MSKTQSTTAKLSDTQLVILSAAAHRANGALLPFAQSLTVKGAALSKTIETLSRRKLVAERRIGADEAAWRRDEDGHPLGLFITTSGLLALGVDDAEKNGPSQASASISRLRKKAVARPRRRAQKKSPASSKATSTCANQTGPGGPDASAAVRRQHRRHYRQDQVAAAFGAGFLSGVVRKKLKLPLVSDVGKDGVRRYHIAPIISAKA